MFYIIWSQLAETQLDEIYDYNKRKANIQTAKKLVQGIIIESEKLKEAPFIDQKEENLKNRKIEYLYLVFKNYKIIYYVDKKDNSIKISDVFDTRQNPPKIRRTK